MRQCNKAGCSNPVQDGRLFCLGHREAIQHLGRPRGEEISRKLVRLSEYCQQAGVGKLGGSSIDALIEDHQRLAALCCRREHEVARKDARVQALEEDIASGPVPAGKYAYVASKRLRQARGQVVELEKEVGELHHRVTVLEQEGEDDAHLAARQSARIEALEKFLQDWVALKGVPIDFAGRYQNLIGRDECP